MRIVIELWKFMERLALEYLLLLFGFTTMLNNTSRVFELVLFISKLYAM